MGKRESTGDAEIDALIASQDHEDLEDETAVDLSAAGEEQAPAPVAGSDVAAMGQAIGAAIAGELRAGLRELTETIQNDGFVKQIPFSKATFNSSFNPTGSKNRPKLVRKVYLNHIQADPNRMTDEEIRLCNELLPGRFFDNIVEVKETNHNGSLVLEVNYSNKTVEQRMDFMTKVGRSFAEVCQNLIAEAKRPQPAARR